MLADGPSCCLQRSINGSAYLEDSRMYSLHLKNWFGHVHPIPMHSITAGVDHLVHDSRFWAVLGLAALVVFAIWATIASTGQSIETVPFFPLDVPFMPYPG